MRLSSMLINCLINHLNFFDKHVFMLYRHQYVVDCYIRLTILQQTRTTKTPTSNKSKE